MKPSREPELALSRAWLDDYCHHSGVRKMLLRGLEYVEAMSRAGLSPESVGGDQLYEFLCDAANHSARTRAFVQPTM